MEVEEINYTYGQVVTAAAGESGLHDFLTVQAAKKLKIKRVHVHFPAGSQYLLHISFIRGAEQVFPVDGYIAGDDCTYSFNCKLQYESGETVQVKFENADAGNPHSCFILVEGVMM